MANKTNEIGDIVKKCKILLLDIEGTTTSISFVKDKLFPYAEENVKGFLESEWDKDDVKEAVTALRKIALEDQENKLDGAIPIPAEDVAKDEQIEGLVKNVKWQMSADRKVGALKTLQGLIWKQGYDKGEIKGHVYDDVKPALEQWLITEGQKVYIYSSGSVKAQKLLFGLSLAGDMLPLIEGHFDTEVGGKQESSSYTAIAEKIACKPEEILFLTDIVKEAEAARTAGINAALVSREGNATLPAEATASFPVIHSFAQLTISNKRKPEPQDEQPAKVAKTLVEADVKTVTEVEAKQTLAAEKVDEPEKMEVETDEIADKESIEQTKEENTKEKIETVVTEVPDAKDIIDTPDCEMEPVVTEANEETKEKESANIETETKTESDPEPKDKINLKQEDEENKPEKSPDTVITEIEDVTEKEGSNEVAEMIEDIQPVIEEPDAGEDIEELKNVGEVLGKECDEILSKVQDVINMDNIPVKPILNPIAEETMETDNTDSNDIVDKILDAELELADKKFEGDTMEVPEDTTTTKVEDVDTEKTDQKVVTPTETVSEKLEETEQPIKKNATTETEEDKTNADDQTATVEIKEPMEEETEISKLETEKKAIETEDKKTVPEDNNTENKKVEPEEKKTVMEVSKVVPEEKVESEENKMDSEDSGVDDTNDKIDGDKVEDDNVMSPAEKSVEPIAQPEVKENNGVAEEVKPDSKGKDSQVNGKATNGNAKIDINGDSNKDDELSSRLAVENGKEMNGANGDSSDAQQEPGDKKVDTEVADIKVKSVATDESRGDPIEQPTEA